MKDLHDVIIRPVLSEKSFDGMGDRTYVFVVQPKATKTQIKAALEEAFGVDIESVNTLRRKGKLKRQGRTEGYTPEIKKAYVKLKADSKGIPFFEEMAQ